LTVIPWRRSRAEQEARALHPSAAAARSRRRPDPATRADTTSGRDHERDWAEARDTDELREDSIVRLCSADRCRRYLGASAEGRLSYSTGRGPVTLVVPYIVGGLGSLLIPVAPFNEARQYVPGQEVTLEVTGSSPEFVQWVVRVTGTAGQKVLLAGDGAVTRSEARPADPPPVPTLDNGELAVLVLPMSHIRGFGIMAPRWSETEGAGVR
jgi:hypothetical protein